MFVPPAQMECLNALAVALSSFSSEALTLFVDNLDEVSSQGLLGHVDISLKWHPTQGCGKRSTLSAMIQAVYVIA